MDADGPRLAVGLLGPLEVSLDGRPLEIPGARLRSLLCRLAVDPGRRVSTAALVTAVWVDGPPGEPVNALQSLVSRLRRLLGGAEMIQQVTTGYRLALAREDLDAARLADGLQRASAAVAAGEEETAYAELDEIVRLWRGDPLTDARDADYVPSVVARWSRLYRRAVQQRAELALAGDRDPGLAGVLEELLSRDPLDESLALLGMRAHVATGRPAEALRTYERTRTALAEELGTDPGPELRALHLALLHGEVAATPTAARPARPALRTWLTTFVGREADLERVLSAVSTHRLVTVLGPGGAGKTRLALEAANRWLTMDRGQAWVVELAPVTEPGNLPAAVLGGVGAVRDARLVDRGERPAVDDRERLLETLRRTPGLLVIDNCEHLVGPVAALVDQILAAAPGVRVLATSREPLGILGELVCPLSTLPLPAEGATRDRALRSAAVQLWRDRALTADPDYRLDEDSVAAAVEIVRRLDGLPLAIELAAARLRVLAAPEIARRLSDRFRLLSGGNRTALPRHQTLRAVVEWSWDLLSAAERLLSERLAVFPAGADLDSATAVCGRGALAAEDLELLMLALVDKSLLQSEAAAGGLRFRMLETIREYGVERLRERGELEQVRLDHAHYFWDLVVAVEPVLRGPDQLRALATLAVERENTVAAVRFLGDGGRPREALEMVLALVWYWGLMGSTTESHTWLSFAIEANADDPPPTLVFARAALVLNRMNDDNSEAARAPSTPNAEPALEDLATLAQELVRAPDAPFPSLEAMRPMVAHFARRPELAEIETARARASSDPWVRAAGLTTAAFSAENASDTDGMRRATAAAYEQFVQLGDRWGVSSSLLVRARVATLDGRLDDAEADYRQAGQLLAELGASSDDELYLRIRMADLYARRGDLDEARRQVAELVPDTPASTDRDVFASAGLASIEAIAGDLPAALDRARRLRADLRGAGRGAGPFHHRTAIVLATSGWLEAVAGEPEQARTDLTGAYAEGLASADMPIVALVGVAVAQLAATLGRCDLGALVLGAAAQVRDADDAGDPLIAQLTAALRAGDPAFDQHFATGRALPRPAAVARLDPTLLD